ncbi:MAG TPA: hypothetical protein VGN73_01490 [Gemmatimonadaceae bacterium]|nr:hypothetical protein [Gemmatimonadaceae bacterium]
MKVIRMVVAAATVSLACGHEPRNDELSAGDNVSPLGPNGEARMFVADQDSSFTRLCFEAPDLGLAPGTAVTVVHPAFPQFSTPGRLGKRTKSPCFPAPRASRDSMMYSVDAPGDTIGRRGVPIIILGKLPNPEMHGDTVTLVIEPGRAGWQFRTCASEEGIHATAWSGKPLTAPRRWHAYYYLGYDVEPDCTPADFAPDSISAAPIAKQ